MNEDKALDTQDKTQSPEDITPKGSVSPSVQKEPSPADKPHTYTSDEVDRLVQQAKMEAGRERKAVEVERDHFKLQLQQKGDELGDIQDERVRLQAQIDGLSGNDPEAFNLVKLDRDVKARELELKSQIRALEAEKQTHADRMTEAQELDTLVTVYQVAGEYGDADELADRLADLCETVEANTEEKIRAIAKTLWEGLKPETPQPAKPYSGITGGGTGLVRNKDNPDETLKGAFRNIKK